MKTKRPSAFSLVEILVVVSIIAILASLSIRSARARRNRPAWPPISATSSRSPNRSPTFETDNNGRIPNSTIPLDGNVNANFMESVDRNFTPDAQYSKFSQYNYPRRALWYSKSFAKMPAGQTIPSGQYYWGLAWGMNTYLWFNSFPPYDFNGYITRAPNRSKLVIVGEKNRSGGHDFTPNVAPEYGDNVQTSYRVSRSGKAYYLFGDYHVDLIEGDQSTIAHPEYLTYSPTNRLYYRW